MEAIPPDKLSGKWHNTGSNCEAVVPQNPEKRALVPGGRQFKEKIQVEWISETSYHKE